MNLTPYIENIRRQLIIVAEAGGEELAEPLEAAVRITLQDALAVAAEEITLELAPGSVELRLRGRDPEFVVTPPPAKPSGRGLSEGIGEQAADEHSPAIGPPPPSGDGTDGGMARINLRMPDHLKSRVEDAADRQGLSVNAWLVRAATAALERTDRARQGGEPAPKGSQRYKGWAR